MKFALANDRPGRQLCETIKAWLEEQGHETVAMGSFNDDSVDYPDFAKKACDLVSSGECERAILVCGSGIGMAISANKIKGCRAAVLHNEYEAKMFRAHNNGNVACFGARQQGEELVLSCLKVFVEGEFEGGRHVPRVDKMTALEGD